MATTRTYANRFGDNDVGGDCEPRGGGTDRLEGEMVIEPTTTTTPKTDKSDDSVQGAAAPISETTVDTATSTRKRDKHLYQIDLVRLVTFAGVILDHVVLGIATPVNVAAGGIGLFLRYTRYSFFALTGFVLTYQYRNRELKAIPFWRRRYKLIGLPFLVWSLFYWTYGRYEGGGFAGLRTYFDSFAHLATTAKSIGYDLITGNAWYHLYFLSVSMQIYAIFPLLLWVLRRTWGYHRYLLAISLAFQITIMYLMVRPPLPIFVDGPLGMLWRHLVVTLFPYQFFVLAGCVAAMHYEAFQRFMIRWRWQLLGGGSLILLATLLYYLHDVDTGSSVTRATNVFMLQNTLAYVAIIVILYALGTMWQNRRTPDSIVDSVMRTASDRSFAIYLSHALVLAELRPQIVDNLDKSPGLVIVASFLATVALTIFVVEVLRRSPISLITTGRSTIDWRTQNAGRSMAVGIGAVIVGLAVRILFDIQAATLVSGAGALLIISATVVYWHRYRAQEEAAVA